MKRFIAISLVLCLSLLSFSACGKKADKYHVDELSFDGTEIVAKPSDAYYKEDGSFYIKYGICNRTNSAKKVTAVTSTVYDKDQRVLAEKQEFKLSKPIILALDEVQYIECVYTKDFVKLQADLASFKYQASISYESAVKETKDPEATANKITMKIQEAYFDNTGSLTGTLKLKNNFKEDKQLSKIHISAIKNDKGKVMTKQAITIDKATTVKKGEMLSVPFLVAPSGLVDNIADYKSFENLTIEYTIETK